VGYVEGFIEKLGLTNVTLVIHDWGSALGFHYAARHESNVKGLAFMEAILATIPSWDAFPPDVRSMFTCFRTPEVGWDMIVNQNIFVEKLLPGQVIRKLTKDEMDAYREPFLDPASRKPVWRWPNEVPIAGEPADTVAAVDAYNAWLKTTDLPKLLLYAAPGVIITSPVADWCKGNLKNLTAVEVGAGLHYVQEDNPHAIGAAIAEWYRGL